MISLVVFKLWLAMEITGQPKPIITKHQVTPSISQLMIYDHTWTIRDKIFIIEQ